MRPKALPEPVVQSKKTTGLDMIDDGEVVVLWGGTGGTGGNEIEARVR